MNLLLPMLLSAFASAAENPCPQSTRLEYRGQAYVVAAGECSLPLRFQDDQLGLRLYSAGATEPYDRLYLDRPFAFSSDDIDVVEWQSARHFFPARYQLMELKFPTGLDALRSNGVSFENHYLNGVLSEMSLVFFPGQPARIVRETDLPLLTPPFGYFRLAFAPSTLAAWIDEILAGTRVSPLRFESRDVQSGQITTRWQASGREIEEVCSSAGNAGESHGEIGGIDPFGIGGIDPFGIGGVGRSGVLCHLRETAPTLAPLRFVYRRGDDGLAFDAPANVHQLLAQEEAGWRVLREVDEGTWPAPLATGVQLARAVEKLGLASVATVRLHLLLLLRASGEIVTRDDFAPVTASLQAEIQAAQGNRSRRAEDGHSDLVQAEQALLDWLYAYLGANP